MSTMNQPNVTVNIVNANQTVANTGQRVLIVGAIPPAGASAPAGVLVPQIDNSLDYVGLFGERSMLTAMIKAYKRINEATRLDILPIAEVGSNTAFELSIQFTGTATEDGVLFITVGSNRDYTFELAITSGDAAATIATNFAALFGPGSFVDFPFTVGVNVSTVTFTAADGNKGTVMNGTALAVSGTVAGITELIQVETTGAGTPVLTGVLDAVGANRYQGVVWPWSDTTELQAFLDPRFNPTGVVLDGVGFVPFVGSLSDVQTQVTENDQSIVYEVDDIAAETNAIGASQQEWPYMAAAYTASIRALRMDSSGQSLGGLVISTFGSLDGFGSPALASKPYFNTPLSFVNVNDVSLGYDSAEIESLIAAGASTYGNNVSATAVVLGEMVTTYLTDSAGNPDDTFKFLNYVDTASQAREYFFNNLRARFAQSRLTEGDTIPGRDMANAVVIQSFCKQLYQALSGVDFVLLEAGEAALNFFIENLIIAIDKQTGTVTIQMEVPLVVQLRVINATLKIAFSVNG